MPRYDVFISYAHSDIDVVKQAYDYLKSKDVECFFDKKGIYGGENYPKKEKNAIADSQKFVLFLSKNCFEDESNLKLRVEIQRELEMASPPHPNPKKPIIPFVLDKTNYNDYKDSPALKQFLGETSALFLDKTAKWGRYRKLLESISHEIKLINYIKEEFISNFSAIEKRANERDPSSQRIMGDYFRCGRKLEVDYDKAIEWYKRAAEQKDEESYLMLGACYLGSMVPLIKRVMDREVSQRSIIKIKEIKTKHNEAKEWYIKAATSQSRNYSGLLDLFEKNVLWRSIPYFLPDEDTFKVFCDISTEDEEIRYRLCVLLYSIITESIFLDDATPDDATKKVVESRNRALDVLNSLAGKHSVSAILFLAAAYYHGKGLGNLTKEERISRVIELLNDAFSYAGEELFKFDLSKYHLDDCGEFSKDCLSYKLLFQESPNPIGLQIGIKNGLLAIDKVDPLVKRIKWSNDTRFLYLGLAALHVDLSFAAMWLTLASNRGNAVAKRVLADFYAENIILFNGGDKGRESYHSGAIDNLKRQLQNGVKSGDRLLDDLVDKCRKDGTDIRKLSNSYFVDSFEKNMSKAADLYREIEAQKELGRLYYWGLGVPKDKDMAQRYCYGDTDAADESDDFNAWLRVIKKKRKEEQELNRFCKNMPTDLAYYEECPVGINNNAENIKNVKRIHEKRLEELNAKAGKWRKLFPDLPCPYEVMMNECEEKIAELNRNS